jgi:hypothetical protein
LDLIPFEEDDDATLHSKMVSAYLEKISTNF